MSEDRGAEELKLHHQTLGERQIKTDVIRQSLAEGRLIRMAWDRKKREFFDIPAPAGMTVSYYTGDEMFVTKGKTPSDDRGWRHFLTQDTPDPRITVGDIAWKRDEKGHFSIPVMHPKFEAQKGEQNPTLGLEEL